MAFSSTPSSGAAPYVYSATFTNKSYFDSGVYILQFYSTTLAGSCPTVVNMVNNQAAIAAALLATGTYTEPTSSVPAGSCRRYALVVRDTRDNTIVQQLNFNINNI